MKEAIAEFRMEFKMIHDKLDTLKNEGCIYGRNTQKQLDEHRVQHRTAYALFGVIAMLGGWLASKIFK
jgi:hypothetical protein